ncbi:hypothetical protein HY640_01930 [Candidatus Woesearchaeota archaeon]|nr:hypothetical protein [Candidatus Woesearchaeota archaeon]
MKANKLFVFTLFLFVLPLAAATPVLNSIGGKSVSEGSTLSFNISTSNSNINSTVFAFSSTPAMAGAALSKVNNSLASFTWTPGFTSSGSYVANFTVNDTGANTSSSAGEVVTITVNDVPAGLTTSSLVLGSRSQQRSNPRSNDDSDINILVTGTVTVTNTGIEPVSGLNVSSIVPTGGFSSSAINMSLSSVSQASINRTESATLVFTARVPDDLDAVDSSSLAEKAFQVATVSIRGNLQTGGTITQSFPVTMQAKNNLNIKDVKVTVDGDTEDVTDGDDVKDVRPGSKVSIELEVENRFNKDDDVDLVDVEVDVTNDDLDVDEDESMGDIGPKKTKKTVITFEVPDDADRDDYDIEIRVEADDDNGARHGEVLRFSLEVEREEHEISFKRAEVSPESVSCEQRVQLRVDISNTGQNDEEDVFIRVASPDLSFGDVAGPFELDEDDSRVYNADIPLPANMSPGVKRIGLESYYDGDQLSKKDVVLLRVSRCSEQGTSAPPVTAPPQRPVEVVQQPRPSSPVVAQPAVEEKGLLERFSESPYYVPVLIGANVVVLLAGVFLVGSLLKK